ncbi:hypothetical protein BGZ94_000717 [Podila epigama]|nr:hypothetical protein BGZ94_000717 [Podila epigama]
MDVSTDTGADAGIDTGTDRDAIANADVETDADVRAMTQPVITQASPDFDIFTSRLGDSTLMIENNRNVSPSNIVPTAGIGTTTTTARKGAAGNSQLKQKSQGLKAKSHISSMKRSRLDAHGQGDSSQVSVSQTTNMKVVVDKAATVSRPQKRVRVMETTQES